jgi:hypothetical protein
VVRIVGALVNQIGPAPEAETVTLLNASLSEIDLAGWSILDRLQPPVQLGNRGGLITLLDPAGLKVDGVAYTKDQADTEGWTVTF